MVWYGWGFTVQLDKCVLLVDKVCCQNEGKNTEMVINHVTDSCACLCLNVTYIVSNNYAMHVHVRVYTVYTCIYCFCFSLKLTC